MTNNDCCTSGHLHSGTPIGSIQDIHGIPTYTTGSISNLENLENVIVLLSDIFGIEFPNLQLLADQLTLVRLSNVYNCIYLWF